MGKPKPNKAPAARQVLTASDEARRRFDREQQQSEEYERARAVRTSSSGDGPETWGVDAGITELQTGNGVTLRRDITGKITYAERSEVFDILARTRLKSGATVLDAAHMVCIDRLQKDLAIRHQTVGASGMGAPVDNSGNRDGMDLRLAAGERLDFVAQHCGVKSYELLFSLLGPSITRGESVDWRAVVERVMGVTNEAAQPSQVRHACDNLLGAYTLHDNARARRRVAA
jgi:putative ubiquitin-RnfH superfamily antitoxin RatB of RatAB toxin-antitoxin module